MRERKLDAAGCIENKIFISDPEILVNIHIHLFFPNQNDPSRSSQHFFIFFLGGGGLLASSHNNYMFFQMGHGAIKIEII